ncbi:MAG: AI-2E family transporter [Streptosporangiales bacterium]|nr:AI-2E family transporter [Streptosporangiales bacterium]
MSGQDRGDSTEQERARPPVPAGVPKEETLGEEPGGRRPAADERHHEEDQDQRQERSDETGYRRLLREAGADDVFPFGRPGRPLRAHAFLLGFTGALGAFTAWLLVQAVLNARQVLVLIMVALFLSIGLNPLVEVLRRRGVWRPLAIGAVFVLVIGFFVIFGFAIVPPVTAQVSQLAQDLPSYVQQLQQNETLARLDQEYRLLENAQSYLASGDVGSQAFGGLLDAGRVVLGAFFSTLTVLILTLYFLSALPTIKDNFYRLVPRSRRARVALLGDEILTRIGGYVGGQLTIGAIAGTTSFLFLEIVGVPYALALSLIVAVLDLVPMIGAIIAAVIVSVVGFLTDPTIGVACVIFFVAYQQFENYVIYPRVMKRSVNVPPAVTIIAALVGGTLLGVVGALIAIPTAAALQLILREVIMPRQESI